MSETLIDVQNLKKTFRVPKKGAGLMASVKSLFHQEWIEKEALKGVNLQVKAGEIVGLVGANGAGKTTLVKALTGIIHPTSGQAKVLGFTPWERNNDFRRQISLIMGQKAQLWWDLPAEDCFLLLKEIYRIPEDEYKRTLNDLVERLDAGRQLNVQIRRLSLGERMKMELIAALLHKPKVLFLDEPTIGLDFNSQKAIRKFVLEYRKKSDVAVLLTSHYMQDIEEMCERIVIIREGEFIFDDPLAKLQRELSFDKVLTAHLSQPAKLTLPAELGEVLENTDTVVRVRMPRAKTSETAQKVLSSLPVADLTIEEQSITDVIATIMKKGLHT